MIQQHIMKKQVMWKRRKNKQIINRQQEQDSKHYFILMTDIACYNKKPLVIDLSSSLQD